MLTPQQIIDIRKRNSITPIQPQNSVISELDAAWGNTQQPEEKKGFIGRVKDAFKKRVDNAAESQNKAIEGKQSIFSSALQTIGQGAGFVGDLGTEAVKAIVPDSIEEKVSQNIQDEISSGKGLIGKTPALLEKYESWKTEHPEAAANLEAVVDIASLLPVGKGAQVAVKGAENGLNTAVKTGTKVLANQAEKKAISAFDDALEVVRPALSPTEKELALKQGRVRTSGLLRKTEITPDVNEQRVAESIQQLVQDRRVVRNALPEKNIGEIGMEVSRINNGVKGFIAENKVPFNERQLRTKLKSVRNDNEIVFASDPTLEKISTALEEAFVNHVKSKDTLGLFEARQSFDKIPAIKKLLESEKLGENAKRQLVLDIRQAANDYISELLPVNNPYKALLKQETYMLRAIDNIAGANRTNIDTNALGRLVKRHPIIKKALPWVFGGIGGAVVGEMSN